MACPRNNFCNIKGLREFLGFRDIRVFLFAEFISLVMDVKFWRKTEMEGKKVIEKHSVL